MGEESVVVPGGVRSSGAPLRTIAKISVVLPCFDEEESVAGCVRDALETIEKLGIDCEAIVVDNGSTDDSAMLAEGAGARVVSEPQRGYGRAYRKGFALATGDVIVMADPDSSYDLTGIPAFLARLGDGAEMVVGNRMNNIADGAMPWHRRHIGNPVLSRLLNFLFHSGIADAHCGMRALRADLLPRLDLRTSGMEFASEMIVRAVREGVVMGELPIEYLRRKGKSKLKSFRDGWRHVRYLLLESPSHLFLMPGALAAILGVLLSLVSLVPLQTFGWRPGLPSLIAGSLMLVLGVQLLMLCVFAYTHQTQPVSRAERWLARLRDRRLEHGLLLGLALVLVGVAMAIAVVLPWGSRGFAHPSSERVFVAAVTLLVLGVEVAFSSCLVRILAVRQALSRG